MSRTYDFHIFSVTLYHLSYASKYLKDPHKKTKTPNFFSDLGVSAYYERLLHLNHIPHPGSFALVVQKTLLEKSAGMIC